jgi:glycosyltransferase involved in cell wall biosynthesis
MSISAGRQNGLIEAGACKKALISTHVGIADQLIEHEKNGLLVERNKESLIDALKNIKKYINFYGRAIRKEIEQKWAWHLHVKYFEDLFIKVLSLEHD